jgi:hypothetical protein
MAAYIDIHIPSRLAIAIITKGIANTHKASRILTMGIFLTTILQAANLIPV